MIIESRAAYRYAKAMLEIAVEQNILDSVIEDFRTLEFAIEGSRDLRNLLTTPVLDVERKAGLILDIFEGKVSKPTELFLRLITKKGRAPLLQGIVFSFHKQLDVKQGLVTAQVTTAVPLNDTLKKEIESRLAVMTGKKIQADYLIDSDLIGGFVARIDDRMIDASVRHQLDRLHETLVGEAGAWTATI